MSYFLQTASQRIEEWEDGQINLDRQYLAGTSEGMKGFIRMERGVGAQVTMGPASTLAFLPPSIQVSHSEGPLRLLSSPQSQ